jgi:hypothetical protein
VNGIDVGNDVIFTVTLLNTAEEGTYSPDFYFTVGQNFRLGLMTEDRGSISGDGFSN